MADNDGDDAHLETAASTPTSSHYADGSASGLKSAKDRACPFCGQAFTSSSLGRHLDLYIKPRNPKPADGVHDVEEIKKMRGSITRRQPKANLKPGANVNASGWKKGDSEEGTPAGHAPPHHGSGSSRNSHSQGAAPAFGKSLASRVSEVNGAIEPSPDPIREHPEDPVKASLNVLNWQATGVINNLPPRRLSDNAAENNTPRSAQVQRIQQMRRDSTGKRVQRPDYDSTPTLKLQEAAEVGRAAELALREVLGSLEAAKAKAESGQLFEDVDFFSLSFPALCLAVLPAPSTLFSSTPFPGSETWTLTPPGQKQFESLNRVLGQRIQTVRNGKMSNFLDSDVFKHNVHLQSAYEHWCRMTEPQRQETWTLETLRSFSRANEAKDQAKSELEAAQNRVRHLEAEYDRLSRCQLPREYLLHPPTTMPAPAALVKEMQHNSHHLYAQAAAELNYDVDALLAKWRTAVKATQRKQAAPTASSAADRNPDQTGLSRGKSARDDIIDYEKRGCEVSSAEMSGDMIMNGAIFGVNGAMPRPGPGHDIHDSPADGQVRWDYETPENPGAVVEDEEMAEGYGDEAVDDADEDAEGEADDDESGHYGRQGKKNDTALVRQTRSGIRGEKINGVMGLNPHGKRPLGPTQAKGRSGGPKVLRER
ncbi:hypothetical protein B0A50_05003 [Salinomyces thailandicus]|uniref:Uncharacterized protein n=1 Tax=Salinomyces thailandicus TaxID=706561 RepID=A0A4U0TY09_9PEZI|nr:hypothetical protein B0A50_05003 [Salinomyces thailandica]